MVILEPLSFSYGNVSNLTVGLYLFSRGGSYSALSPVVHGDIAQSINTNTKKMTSRETQKQSTS